MSNAYAGIKGGAFCEDYASFNYLGYVVNVNFDRHEVEIEKDKKVIASISNVGWHKAASHDEKIRAVKEAVISQYSRDRNREDREHHNEIMAKVDYAKIDAPGSIATYEYKGHQIDIFTDDFVNDCPWDDWDQEPSAMSKTFRSFGGWSHAYGKNDIGSIPDYRIPADVDRAEFAIRYIQIAHRGVAEEFYTQSNRYIAYFTGKEIRDWFDGDREFARYALSESILTFEEWAESGPHGFRITRNGEDIDDGTMSGIYDHHGYSYAVSEAIAIIDGEVQELEELEAEVESEKLTELGYV